MEPVPLTAPGETNPLTIAKHINTVAEVVNIIAFKCRIEPRGTARIVGDEFVIDTMPADNNDPQTEESAIQPVVPPGYVLTTLNYCDADGVPRVGQFLMLSP
jgi:hypothetical protein